MYTPEKKAEILKVIVHTLRKCQEDYCESIRFTKSFKPSIDSVFALKNKLKENTTTVGICFCFSVNFDDKKYEDIFTYSKEKLYETIKEKFEMREINLIHSTPSFYFHYHYAKIPNTLNKEHLNKLKYNILESLKIRSSAITKLIVHFNREIDSLLKS